MEKIVPISDLQSGAKKLVDEVKATGDVIVITRRGRAAVVLADYERFFGMLATLEELSNSEALAKFKRGLSQLEAGEKVELEEYLVKRGR